MPLWHKCPVDGCGITIARSGLCGWHLSRLPSDLRSRLMSFPAGSDAHAAALASALEYIRTHRPAVLDGPRGDRDYGGAFDGFRVTSDADPGL
jgi:hypothetical protein